MGEVVHTNQKHIPIFSYRVIEDFSDGLLEI